MSVWFKTSEQLPPLDEEVLILYKFKEDELDYDNLYYGLSRRVLDTNFRFERWSHFAEYQGYYEVVYWARLYDMPQIIKEQSEDEEDE